MLATDTPTPRRSHASDTPLQRRSRAVDPATRALRWAKSGRSKEAQLYRATVSRLRQHVGGKPNHAEALLIGRIAWLQVHLARIDERAMQAGGLSPHATREYLAWSNSIAKMLGRLGMQAVPPRQITLADHIAASSSHTATSASTQHSPALAAATAMAPAGGR